MKSIYNYDDFRVFIKDHFRSLPKAGYGQSLKLAHHLGVHSTFVSQVLKNQKSFSVEQAITVAEFLNLNERETDFFVTLVLKDRAGSQKLQKFFRKKLEALSAEAQAISNRVRNEKKLDEKFLAEFYSHWSYSAIRQMTAIPQMNSVEKIAQTLKLTPNRVSKILDFLTENGLCVKENGVFAIGPQSTFLPTSSKWIHTNQMNWRLKSVENFSPEADDDLRFTCPLTISKKDALRLREMIVHFIEKVDPMILESPSEQLHCLIIDWFQIA